MISQIKRHLPFPVIPVTCLAAIMLLTILWCGDSQQNSVILPISSSQPKSTAKAITFFAILDPLAVGVVDEIAKSITVALPSGTDRSYLVAAFITTGTRIAIDGVDQINSMMVNDFTAPLVYTVWAEDGTFTHYTVSVTYAGMSAKRLTSFSFSDPAAYGVINEYTKTVSVLLPCDAVIGTLTAFFTTTGAAVTVDGTAQASGTSVNDFASPVIYRVHAPDETWVEYTVIVGNAPQTDKSLTSFSILGINGVIDEDAKTVTVTVPLATDVTSLVPTFTNTGKNVFVGVDEQESGTTPQNFAAAVPYRVIACDDSVQDYIVTVTGAGSSNANLYGLQTDPDVSYLPEFNATKLDYSAAVCGVTSITLNPTAEDAAATITAGGNAVASGSWTEPISLTAGAANDIAVAVRAQNGMARTYHLTVTVSALSCSNSCQDGGETDVDCGGSCAPAQKCDDGGGCNLPGDCTSGVCVGHICRAPNCSDSSHNGDETDVDCGGSCQKCGDSKMCSQASDCMSGVCTGGTCKAPSCSDIVRNGIETDVDCGGSCPKCLDAKLCAVAGDCVSGVCSGNPKTCQVPACVPPDGVKNGIETDVDCGGGSCPTCANNKSCNVDSDCTSGMCYADICRAPYYIQINDGVRNWSNGTQATSCNGYRNPAPPYAYTGATGDGIYRIYFDGVQRNVYCDMTTDGGGWTLISKVVEPSTVIVGSDHCTDLTPVHCAGDMPNEAVSSNREILVRTLNGTYWMIYANWSGTADSALRYFSCQRGLSMSTSCDYPHACTDGTMDPDLSILKTSGFAMQYNAPLYQFWRQGGWWIGATPSAGSTTGRLHSSGYDTFRDIRSRATPSAATTLVSDDPQAIFWR